MKAKGPGQQKIADIKTSATVKVRDLAAVETFRPGETEPYEIIGDPELVARLKKEWEEKRKLKAEVERLRKEREPVGEKPLAEQIDFDFMEMVEKAKGVDPIPLLPEIYQDIRYILPHRLTKEELIEDTITQTGHLLRHKREYQTGQNKKRTVFWTTIVPKDMAKKGIPTYGELAKSAYIVPHALAIAQKTASRALFRDIDILRVGGYSEERIKKGGKVFPTLTNIYRTFAYTTIEIVDEENGKITRRDLKHLFDRIIIDEKNKIICTEFTQDDERLSRKYLNKELKPGSGERFVGYSPKQLTFLKDLDHYDKNFGRWVVEKRGFSKRRYYPIRIDTLARKGFIFPQSYYHKKRGWESIYKDVIDRLEEAKGRSIRDFRIVNPEEEEKEKIKIRIDFAVEKPLLERIQTIGDRGTARLLAREMATHCYEHFDNIRKSPEQLEEDFYNTVVVRDLNECSSVFEEFKISYFGKTGDGEFGEPVHPGDLFTWLKQLPKTQKNPGKSPGPASVHTKGQAPPALDKPKGKSLSGISNETLRTLRDSLGGDDALKQYLVREGYLKKEIERLGF